MASAIFYGTLVPVTAASGVFKMAEMTTDRALGLFMPSAKSPDEAKKFVTSIANPLSIVMRKAHPRDDSIEDVIGWAMADSVGICETKAYHNQVFGELFKHYAKSFAKWREGELVSMPTLKSSYSKAKHNPRLADVLSGNAERDALTKAAVERAERAEATAKEAKTTAAAKAPPSRKPTTQPKEEPDETDPSRKHGLTHPKPGESLFKISGKDRKAMRAELESLFKSYKSADDDATAAEAASASDAASKRAQAVTIQAKIDKTKASLAERK